MATATSSAFLFNNSSDANFRAWAQWIHDRLIAWGWTVTADTGQINLATVVAPAAANTSKGYEIWIMGDALQATNPVFLKLEYGSRAAAATPSVWLTVGTGSNGSGTITNGGTRTQIGTSNTPTAGGINHMYGSGSTNRMAFSLGVEDTAACVFFGIERTKDATGADSTEGVVMYGIGANSASGDVGFSQAIPFSGTIPGVEPKLSGDFPSNTGQTTGIFGADVYTYSIKPMMFYPRNPIMGYVVWFTGDFTNEVSITLDIYGASRTYMPFTSSNTSTKMATNARTEARLAMRYE